MKKYHVNDNGDLRVCSAKTTESCRLKSAHYPAGNIADARAAQEIHLAETNSVVPKAVTKKGSGEEKAYDYVDSYELAGNTNDSKKIQRWVDGYSNYLINGDDREGAGIDEPDSKVLENRIKQFRKIMRSDLTELQKHEVLMQKVRSEYNTDRRIYKERKEKMAFSENLYQDQLKKETEYSKAMKERIDRSSREKDIQYAKEQRERDFKRYGFKEVMYNAKISYDALSDEEIENNMKNKTFSTWDFSNNSARKENSSFNPRTDVTIRFNDPVPQPSTFEGKAKAFFTDQKKSEMKRLNNVYEGEYLYLFRKESSAVKLMSKNPDYAPMIHDKIKNGDDWENVEQWSTYARKIDESGVNIPMDLLPSGVEEIKTLNSRVQESKSRATIETSAEIKSEIAVQSENDRWLKEQERLERERSREDKVMDSKAKLEGALSIVNSMSSSEFVS